MKGIYKFFNIVIFVVFSVSCINTVCAEEYSLETLKSEFQKNGFKSLDQKNAIYTTTAEETHIRIIINPTAVERGTIVSYLPQYDAVITYTDPQNAPWEGARWILLRHFFFIGERRESLPSTQITQTVLKHLNLEAHPLKLRLDNAGAQTYPGVDGIMVDVYFRLEE